MKSGISGAKTALFGAAFLWRKAGNLLGLEELLEDLGLGGRLEAERLHVGDGLRFGFRI